LAEASRKVDLEKIFPTMFAEKVVKPESEVTPGSDVWRFLYM